MGDTRSSTIENMLVQALESSEERKEELNLAMAILDSARLKNGEQLVEAVICFMERYEMHARPATINKIPSR